MPVFTLFRRLRRIAKAAISALLSLMLLVTFWRSAIPGALASPGEYRRYGGYGISVGPHLPSRPDLLEQMGMDWVKIYDTAQIADYPNQRILYRIDVPGYPPDWDLEAWTGGLYDLARELSARGVDAVEIGNEPNLSIEWGDQLPDAAKYVDVLRRAYTAFKTEAPHIIVVSAGLAPTAGLPDGRAIDDLVYAQQMLDLGAANYFDAWAYHPYGFNQPPEADPHRHPFSFRRTELMMDLLQRNGVRGKQIWITEFGWLRNPAEAGLMCADSPAFANLAWMVVSSQQQADYTRRAFEFASRNWSWAGPMFLWNLNWNLYDSGYEDDCSHLRWFAILDRDGGLLPVFFAIQRIPRRPPIIYRPEIGAVARNLTRTGEAGCVGVVRLGSFILTSDAEPDEPPVEIIPANAPGRPFVWTSVSYARDGDRIEVFVNAQDAPPGLHLVAINLRAYGTDRMTSALVRGWLLLHHPPTTGCAPSQGGGM